VINVDGTGLQRLSYSTQGPSWDSDPSWSPDGRQIAYTSSGANAPQGIYVMKADGSGKRRLTSGRGADTSPSWSPDGKQIVFVCAGFNELSDVCVVGADGRAAGA
jgi:Tol biopolymer transport system component